MNFLHVAFLRNTLLRQKVLNFSEKCIVALMKTENVRLYLNRVLESKIEKNSNYSMRAFAKQLRENPATLSQILNGKRPITDNRIKKFANALEMPLDQFLYECGEQKSHKSLAVDFFKVISDWYYDAILELTNIAEFKPNIKWISNFLNIDFNITKVAVARLEELELLKTSNKKWQDLSGKNIVAFDTNYSDIALRKYQKQILQKSQESIEIFPRGEREHNSFILAYDSNLNEEVHNKIRLFQKELVSYIEQKSNKKDQVRVIHFGSFPLNNKGEKREH